MVAYTVAYMHATYSQPPTFEADLAINVIDSFARGMPRSLWLCSFYKRLEIVDGHLELVENLGAFFDSLVQLFS